MVFSYPAILWGFLLLAIPIAIHLFQFKRYKKLLFPDVSLLKELQSKSSMRNQLRHLLILFSRLLLLAFLVMAFASPVLPPDNHLKKAQPSLVSLYIDNSFSMDAESEKGRLFDQARSLAYEIASAYPPSTRFQLLTNELSSKQRKALDFNALLISIDETEVGPFTRSIERIHVFHQQTREELGASASVLYLLSDFSGNTGDSTVLGDSLTEVRLVPLESQPIGNLSIDSVRITSPSVQTGMEVELRISITNHGPERVVDVPVEVSISGTNSCRMLLSMPPGTRLDTLCVFQASQPGYYRGTVSVEDFPVVYDNEYFFSLLVNNRVKVVEVGETAESPSPFARLMKEEATFDYQFQPVAQINLSEVAGARFVIFNQVSNWTSGLAGIVNELTAAGKTVMIVPPPSAADDRFAILQSETGLGFGAIDTHRMEANFIEVRHPVYRQVFEAIPKNLNYPHALRHFRVNVSHPSNEAIIRLIDGEPLLGTFALNEGRVYYTSVALTDDFSNFHKHALFVPAIYNMAIQSGRLQPLAYRVGVPKIDLELDLTENAVIRKVNDSLRFRPSQGVNELRLYGQVRSSGFYEVVDGDSSLALLAFNYGRTESDAAPPDHAMIETLAAQEHVSLMTAESERIVPGIAEADLGTKLWPLFVLLALIMAVIETLLLKILKT